jgi:hypothetical protein
MTIAAMWQIDRVGSGRTSGSSYLCPDEVLGGSRPVAFTGRKTESLSRFDSRFAKPYFRGKLASDMTVLVRVRAGGRSVPPT